MKSVAISNARKLSHANNHCNSPYYHFRALRNVIQFSLLPYCRNCLWSRKNL